MYFTLPVQEQQLPVADLVPRFQGRPSKKKHIPKFDSMFLVTRKFYLNKLPSKLHVNRKEKVKEFSWFFIFALYSTKVGKQTN